jgi:hypothetical protein
MHPISKALFDALAPPNWREPAAKSPCPECRDPTACNCPLADNYVCEKCLNTGYRRDWRGTKVQCDDCYPDNGPE